MTRPNRGLWLGVSSLAVVALMAILVPAAPLAIERAWFEEMHDIRGPLLTHVALVFNALGRGIWRALAIAAIGLVLLVARRWLALAAFALAEGITPLASAGLKAAVDRPRPPDGLVHPAGASFPSGHAAYAGATCIALVLVFSTPGPRRAVWWTLAALGVAAMAVSRTYLQVHWLADVIGGSLLGVGVALTAFAGAQLVAAGRRPRRLPARDPARD
jgi:undecaprenyl-diphosphatase